MEKKNSKSIEMIEEILQPEVLDELAMNEIKAGTAPGEWCLCQQTDCFGHIEPEI